MAAASATRSKIGPRDPIDVRLNDFCEKKGSRMKKHSFGLQSLLPLLLLWIVAFSMNHRLLAVEGEVFLLWEQGAPGALGQEPKDKPQVTLHRLPGVERAPLLIICPGGGYGGLAMDHEGHQIVAWALENGMSALLCEYRHRGKGYGHPAPLQDTQRAIRLARSRADQWNIDPAKIGILGFSAGGHLVSTVITHFDGGDPASADPVARTSSRPDFAILCYPVIAFDQPFTHGGSQKNLLGENPDPALVASLSSERQVKTDTPPTFLFHTQEDKPVPPQNSLVFFQAMVEKGVPGELHLFEKGPHGVGLAKSIPGTGEWPNLCLKWLRSRGIVK
jgi:acetyl esterase/lipase